VDDRYDIRTIQKLLGHRDVRTSTIYTLCSTEGEAVSQARLIGCAAFSKLGP
jgi:site-specific recombinase XerD